MNMTLRLRQLLDSVRTVVRRPEVRVMAILYASYAVYIMNRKSVSLSLPALIAYGMSTSTAGMIVSSQNAAYAGSKLVGGVASDYFNPRRLLGIGLICCGMTALLFSYSDNDGGFVFAWFLNGITHGAGWPASAKILQTAAPAHFGTMWSILSTSVNFSGVLSPLLAAFFIPLLGWRWNLRMISGLSALMGLVCLFAITDHHQEQNATDKSATSKEKPKVASPSKRKKSSDAVEPSTLPQLLRSPLLWLVTFSYLIVFGAKAALTDWCQIFLIDEYAMAPDMGSKFASSLEFGGFVGSLIAGYLTDKYIQKKSKRNDGINYAIYVRMLCSLMCAFGVCISLHSLCFYIDAKSSRMIILLIGFLLGAFTYGQIVMYGIVASVMVPPDLSGTSHSIVSLAANVGAVMAGFPLANFAGLYDWRMAFALFEGASAVVVIVQFASLNVAKVKVKTA